MRRHNAKDQENDEADPRIDKGADGRDPGDRLAREDRLFHKCGMLMQKHRCAIGKLAEQVEDDQTAENVPGIFGDADILRLHRQSDGKDERIGEEHHQRRGNCPHPTEQRAAET